MSIKKDPPFQEHSSKEKIFIRKWLAFLMEEFSAGFDLTIPNSSNTVKPDKYHFSLSVASFINLLNQPLFWSGILFLVWLLLTPLLKWLMNPADYFRWIRPYQKFESMISPAVVGYWTNWLAIKMLFYPRHPNWVWQGLIPSRRRLIIDSIVTGITAKLFSPQIITAYVRENDFLHQLSAALITTLSQSQFKSEFQEITRQRWREFLHMSSTQEALRDGLNLFISRWKAETLLEIPLELSKKTWQPLIVDKMLTILPELSDSMDTFFSNLETSLIRLAESIETHNDQLELAISESLEAGFHTIRIEEIIRNQLLKMDEAQLEELLTGNVSGELVFLQTSGGIFGILVGLAVSLPWLRWILLLLGLVLWAIYRSTVSKTDSFRPEKKI